MKTFIHHLVLLDLLQLILNKKKLFGQCVWNDLCNFNLETYIKKGKNKIGIIFNTDPHHLRWFALDLYVYKY